VFSQNGEYFFLNVGYKIETKKIVGKMSGNQLVKKISFFDLRKNESMTQARKEGKEAVDSLRLL